MLVLHQTNINYSEDCILIDHPYNRDHPAFHQHVLLTLEFNVGEEIIIMCINSNDFTKVDFTFKGTVLANTDLQCGYYGPQLVFHGYSHYLEYLETALVYKKYYLKYADIPNAPNNMFHNRKFN